MKTPVIPSTVGSQPGARPDLLPCFRTSGPIQEFRIGPRGRALYQISGSNVRIFTIKILTFEPSPRKREPCHGGASGDSRFSGNDLVLNIPRHAEISHPRSRPRTSGDPESPGSSPRTRRSCNPWVIPAHAEVLQSLGHPRASGGLAIPGSSPRKRRSCNPWVIPAQAGILHRDDVTRSARSEASAAAVRFRGYWNWNRGGVTRSRIAALLRPG